MSIILVRHGETRLNVARTLQPADTPLSPNGVAQATAVALRLAGLRPGGVLSSDLPRARITADAIASTCGLPVAETSLLQERNYGELRGVSYDALGYNPLRMEEAPPGGESACQFHLRVAQAFAEILAQREALDAPLVVVTHGLVIHALLQRHLRLADSQTLPMRFGNTSVTVFSPAAPYAVELLDCTAHLGQAGVHDDAQALSGG